MKTKFRRLMAMVLTTSMVLSMVGIIPTFAEHSDSYWQIKGNTTENQLAAEDYDYHVVDEKTATTVAPTAEADGVPSKTVEDGAVSVSKTIQGTEDEDKFVITLKVETTEEIEKLTLSDDAAVVLVIDNSSSMYQNVAGGSSAPLMSKNGTTGYATAPSSVSQDYLDYVGASNKNTIPYINSGRISIEGNDLEDWRITKAKDAAIEFTNDFMDASGDRYISVVSFSLVAKLETDGTANGWVDNAADATTAINAMRPINYTNIDAGLQMAYDQLQTVPEGVDNLYVILLADGDANRSGVDGTQTDSSTARTAAKTASKKIVNNMEVPLYNVCFTNDSNGLDYLAGETYTAGDLDELIEKLADIDKLIQTEAKAWTVTDPMGSDYITLDTTSFTGASSHGNETPYNQIDPLVEGGTLNSTGFVWDLQESTHEIGTRDGNALYTYTLSYTIQLESEKQYFDPDVYYLTNKETTLDYRLSTTTTTGDVEVTTYKDDTVNFDVPAVKGEVPQIAYKVEHYVQDGFEEDGVTHHYDYKETTNNPTTCAMWEELTAAEVQAYQQTYDNYTFNAAKGDALNGVTIKVNGQVIELYYDQIPTTATVNHYFYDVTDTDSGKVYTPADGLDMPGNPEDGYVGDTYEKDAMGTNGTVITSDLKTYQLGDSNFGSYDTDEAPAATAPATTQSTVLTNESGDNIINFYYYNQNIVNEKHYTITVNYEYTHETYEIQGGEYVPVTNKYYGSDADIDTNYTQQVQYGTGFEAKDGRTVTKISDYGFEDASAVGGTLNTDELVEEDVVIDQVTGDVTITIKYLKTDPLPDETEVQIIHKYYVSTTPVDVNGNPVGDPVKQYEGEEPENPDGYSVGETLSAIEDTSYGDYTNYQATGADYLVTNESSKLGTYKILVEEPTKNAEGELTNNTIVIEYVRDATDVKQVEVQVTHNYTYNYEVMDDTGLITMEHAYFQFVEEKDTDDLGSSYTAGYERKYDDTSEGGVGEKSYEPKSASTNTQLEGNNVSTDPKDLEITLENRLNRITINYELTEYLEDNADIHETHTYTTQIKTYENGSLTPTLTTLDPEAKGEQVHSGSNGERYTADADTDFVSKYETIYADYVIPEWTVNAESLTGKMSTEYVVLPFEYTRIIEVYDPAFIQVEHIYHTNETVIDGSGNRVTNDVIDGSDLKPVYTTLDGTAEGMPLYAGMTFTAAKDNTLTAFNGDGTTSEESYTYAPSAEYPEAKILVKGDNGTLELHYYRSVDYTTKTEATENHYYQTTTVTTDASGNFVYTPSGYTRLYTDTEDSLYAEQDYVVSPRYDDYTLTSVDSVPGYTFDEDADTYTLELQTIADGGNVINFYYDKTVNRYAKATLTVYHHYTTTYTNSDRVDEYDGVTDQYLDSYADVVHTYLEKTAAYDQLQDFEVDSTTNDKGTLDTDSRTIILDEGDNVIYIEYVREIDDRPLIPVTVNYFYYLNDVEDGEYEGTEGTTTTDRYVEGSKYSVSIDDYRDFVPMGSEEGYSYSYDSGENTITLTAEGPNTINLYYIREVEPEDVPENPDEPDEPNKPSTKYYDLIVNWVDEDGNKLDSSETTKNMKAGTRYDTEEKSFDGYTLVDTEGDKTSGYMTSDKEVTYVYAPDGTTDIPDEDVPLTDIPDEDVPLSEEPDAKTPEEEDPTLEILEEEVPLSDIPQTGDGRNLGLMMATAIGSAMGLAWLAKLELDDKKKRNAK